jgi:hypothetical protein
MKHLAIKVTNKYESEAVQQTLFDMGFITDDKMHITKSIALLCDNDIKEIKLVFPQFIYLHGHSNYFHVDDEDRLKNIKYILIPSSDFFATYAGHIERFPDYVKVEEITPKPIHLNESSTQQNQQHFYTIPNCNIKFNSYKEAETYLERFPDYVEDKKEPESNFKLKVAIGNMPAGNEITKEEFLEEMLSILPKDIADKSLTSAKNYIEKILKEAKSKTEDEVVGNFFKEAIPKLEKGLKGIKEIQEKRESKLKFQVGDFLYYVDNKGISKFKITRIDTYQDKLYYYVAYHSAEHSLIDVGINWFSTPELAAKRFLELNKNEN